jgi:hypothetical protein
VTGREDRKPVGEAVGKIVFNGQEYACVEAMPDAERILYESIVKTAWAGERSPEEDPAVKIEDPSTGARKDLLPNVPKPIVPRPGVSPRIFILGVAIVVLLLGIYFFIRS